MRDIGDVRWELEELERTGAGEAATAPPSEASASAPRRPAWSGLATAALGLVLGLALAAGYLWVRPRQVAPPKKVKSFLLPPEGTTFSFRPQLGGPVLSPDGSRLVFAAIDESGRTSLWVRPLDSTGARELNGTEGASYPFWSPDSRWIAFFVEGKLRKIDVAGGPPTTICDAANGRGGSWSPEGVILFATNVYSGIERVSAAGGTPATETELATESGQTSHRWPVFLPDGRHYLYWGGTPLNSAESETDGIFVGSLDGGAATFLRPTDSNALYSPPGYLLFLREDVLMAQRFDASSRTLSGEAFPIAEQVASPQNYRLGDFSVSQEGTLVYQTGEAGLSQIVRFDAEGKQVAEVGEPSSADGFRLSPDGSVLAVQVSDERSKNVGLWLIDLARDVRSRFTFEPGLEIDPVWSPDGDRIAYAANPKGRLDIVVKPSSGAGEARPLVESDLTKYPTSWSPDGRLLALTVIDPHGATRSDLWIAPVDGSGEPTLFLSTPFSESNAVFSPDGRWLAYQSNASGQNEIYLTPFPGPGGKWQVSQSGGHKPIWRRDGGALYFQGPDGTLYEVGITEKESGVEVGVAAPVLRLPQLAASPQAWNYEVDPNGTGFLALRQVEASATPLTLVTSWAAELEK
jgi:Tol biopolymer transport system component